MRMLDDEGYHPAVDRGWSMRLPNPRLWKHKGLSDIESAQHYGALQPIAITNSAGQTKSTPLFPGGTHNPTGSPSWAAESIESLETQIDEQSPGSLKSITKMICEFRGKQSITESELCKQAIRLKRVEAKAEFSRTASPKQSAAGS